MASLYSRLQHSPLVQSSQTQLLDALFGTNPAGDEFLGYGRRAAPGANELGLFPMFMDGEGRCYFDGRLQDVVEDAATVSITRCVTFAMRKKVLQSWQHQQQQPRFPSIGQRVVLRPCGMPVFPFCWVPLPQQDVLSSVLQSAPLLNVLRRYAHIFASTSCWRVRSMDQERDASCTITLLLESCQGVEDFFFDVYEPLHTMRLQWSMNVCALFEDMLAGERGMNRDFAARTTALASWLRYAWAPDMMLWCYKHMSVVTPFMAVVSSSDEEEEAAEEDASDDR